MNPIDAGEPLLREDPLWYKDAVIYELHVRSFFDANGDGVGDFQGLTRKLGYLEDLGVTAIWLLPFYPSPLRDDGYDIADYRSVNPDYGTLDDFRVFLEEAHRRGLRVITELVINHTSDQHPWFQRARRAPRGSPEREFYVWSDDPRKYSEARIIFQDFEPSNWTWDPQAEAYYWHRFFHHQPDLNFDNPVVQEELLRILDFWLEMGVDGLRLDAIPYLYQREGTNCENLPETHAFLKRLRAHVDRKHPGRMLLAEANQWPEDAAAYFGDGDECHMNFHFPLMPRLFMSVRMEDRFPIQDILDQTPTIPENCQWGLFLRNHDELTLEMVTDEERDFMYRMYAEDHTARINLGIRRRLAPLLSNSRRNIELLNSLLLSLPGTPILYYGDEIGMGDNIYLGDRHGVRTPMQWAGDRNAGFSAANPQKLFLPVIIDPEHHYEAVNVEAQQRNPSSLLWWMRRLIALRRRHPAFGRGTLEWVPHDNHRVLAFLRRYDGDTILVVANLSRFAQPVSLRLPEHENVVPMELFGHTAFPAIGEGPYPLTLAAHEFLWFSLQEEETEERAREGEGVRPERALPLVRSEGSWTKVLEGGDQKRIVGTMVEFVRSQRWFARKGNVIRSGSVTQVVPLGGRQDSGVLVLLELEYVGAESETYLVPLAYATGEAARSVVQDRPGAVAWRAVVGEEEGVVHDGALSPALCRRLLELVARGEKVGGGALELGGVPYLDAEILLEEEEQGIPPLLGSGDQSNTSLIYGDRWILKLYRRVQRGPNPDVEVGRFLRDVEFDGTPELVGALELRDEGRPFAAAGVLHRFAPNRGDAWTFALDALGRYFEAGLAGEESPEALPLPGDMLTRARARLEGEEVPQAVHELLGSFLESSRRLGHVTGKLHEALASRSDPEAFRPEPFSTLYQRSLYQSIRSLLGTTLRVLEDHSGRLGEEERGTARRITRAAPRILRRFEALLESRFDGWRIRVHGDLHLGQILNADPGFQIIDFEGEPDRSLGERRLKRSPLRDVAGMLRSFDYATRTALRGLPEKGLVLTPRDPRAVALARVGSQWAGVEFLAGYLESPRVRELLPGDPAALRHLLDLFVLEKALYELRYEIGNRPGWAGIPLEGIAALIRDGVEGAWG